MTWLHHLLNASHALICHSSFTTDLMSSFDPFVAISSLSMIDTAFKLIC